MPTKSYTAWFYTFRMITSMTRSHGVVDLSVLLFDIIRLNHETLLIYKLDSRFQIYFT